MAIRLGTVSVVEALESTLRAAVLDGEFAPDQALPETEVAARYGVSRPTAKAALQVLVHAGLLRREANRPARVPRLRAAEIEDLYFVRIPLELHVVAWVAEHGPPPVAAADAVTALRAMPPAAAASLVVPADLAFHRALVEHVGSARLSRLYGMLLGELHLAMVQSRRALGVERIAREHGEVLAALQARDIGAAQARMRAHLEGAGADLAVYAAEETERMDPRVQEMT